MFDFYAYTRLSTSPQRKSPLKGCVLAFFKKWNIFFTYIANLSAESGLSYILFSETLFESKNI